MKPLIKQECPFYASPGRHHLDHAMYKDFDCANCTGFQISVRAERRLLQAPQRWRDSCANKARQAPDAMRWWSMSPLPMVPVSLYQPSTFPFQCYLVSAELVKSNLPDRLT